jgi:hypothetical protein
MHLERSAGIPDRLSCPHCQTAFEAEQGGSMIRVVEAMPQIKAALAGKWMSAAELRQTASQIRAAALEDEPQPAEPTPPPPPEPAPEFETPPGEPPLDPELESMRSRAHALHELGNSLETIRAALKGYPGATDELIEKAMADLTHAEQKERKRMAGIIWVMLLIVIICALGVVILNLLVPRGSAPQPSSQARAGLLQDTQAPGQPLSIPDMLRTAVQPTSIARMLNANNVPPALQTLSAPLEATPLPPVGEPEVQNPQAAIQSGADGQQYLDPSKLPAPIQTMLPPEVKILVAPTPEVIPGDPRDNTVVNCPRDKLAAANLFGGPANDWTLNSELHGWIFISKTTSTIHLPAGMSAGFLVITESMEMKSTLGPATITNVNMIAVSCE